MADDPDTAFVRGMIPHHQGAIDMARIVQQHGDDPQTKAWAEQIIAAQEREIVEMEAWLKEKARLEAIDFGQTGGTVWSADEGGSSISALDLGTGTGAILLSLLADRPGAQGTATDLSEAALAVARGNAAALGIDAAFVRSDWFAQVDGRFDLIVSNPPYIALDEMDGLSPEVRDWEPRSALTDEGDGLAAYRAITTGAPSHLSPGGWLLVEIGPTQGSAVGEMMKAAGFGGVRVLRDLDGRDRVVMGQAG